MAFTLTPAGTFGLLWTDDPATMTAALALPRSWPWDKTRCLLHRDNWPTTPPLAEPPEAGARRRPTPPGLTPL